MKTSRFVCAAMAAVMTVGMSGSITGSADIFAAPETPSFAVVDSEAVENEFSATSGYDKDEWEAYKKNYWDSWEEHGDDEEYDGNVGLDITKDGLIYHINVLDNCIEVADYIGKGTKLVIPAKIDGLPVTGLLDIGHWDLEGYGFNEMKNVKTVVFKAKIERIGSSFTNCPKLEKVTLPEGLKELADWKENTCCAFSDCPKLKEVVIPDTLDFVQNACFKNTPWLEAREKKEGIVIIGSSLLSGRQAEGKVVIPSNVKYLSGGAFHDNTKMTELVIPKNVKDSCGAFWNTTGLKKITFKNGSKGLYEFFNRETVPNLEKMVIPPSFTKENVAYAVGFDKYDGDWKDHIIKNCTYYYYKGTKADKVLNDKSVKGYTKLKKSVLPGKTKKLSAVAKKNAFKATWAAVSTASVSQLQVATDSGFKNLVATKYVSGKTKTAYTFKNLKSWNRYYYRMRTYKTISGKKYYGNYTKARSVVVK
ncbi:MAG: leucine-rich repeat domain-containing protein [Ruminococcus sp.]|nr:leucine-rich repeat domain-containing protein [Ruminococcus sp.]